MNLKKKTPHTHTHAHNNTTIARCEITRVFQWVHVYSTRNSISRMESLQACVCTEVLVLIYPNDFNNRCVCARVCLRARVCLCFKETSGEKTNNGIHYRLQLLYSNGE